MGGGGGGGGAFDFSGESQPISGGRVENGGVNIAPTSTLAKLPVIAWVAIGAAAIVVLVKVLK